MDARHFDQLTKLLTAAGSRRGLFGLLATLPILGGLVALLDRDETGARGRRKRHKQRSVGADNHKRSGRRRKHKSHHSGKKHHQKHKKHQKSPCTPEPKTTTCAGKCGTVRNNCKKTVDCGPCECDPPCGTCQTCSPELVCEACDPCCDGVCCDQSTAICHLSDDTCCVPEDAAETCAGQCGDVVNNCGQLIDCTAQCSGCCDGTACVAVGDQTSAQCGTSTPGAACAACAFCQTCDGGQCVALHHTCDGPCPAGQWCDAGDCADIQETVTFPDCHSLCNGSTEICGQTVTCPSCDLCPDQTGCNSTTLPDGPVGVGTYCCFAGQEFGNCATNDDCEPGDYCSNLGTPLVCARICPF